MQNVRPMRSFSSILPMTHLLSQIEAAVTDAEIMEQMDAVLESM